MNCVNFIKYVLTTLLSKVQVQKNFYVDVFNKEHHDLMTLLPDPMALGYNNPIF